MDAPTLNTLVADLFLAIQALSGYTVPPVPPDIHIVPAHVMQQKACGKPCAVKAFYHPEWGVYLDEKLDLAGSPFDRSVLLHELVHHVQNVSGRFERMPLSCERNQLAEMEAYKVQNLYLAAATSRSRALYLLWTTACSEDAASHGE
jgi:hypothetical protein